MSQPSATLGALLRQLRLGVGATQKDVADALKVGETSISQYESGRSAVPDARLRDFATFVVLSESGHTGGLVPDGQLTELQRTTRAEMLSRLREARRPSTGQPRPEPAGAEEPPAADLWTFDPGEPITIVVGQLQNMTHPYANTRDPNYTEVMAHADMDALIELYGHLRMRNPDNDEIRFVRSDRFIEADQMSSHVVVIGGPGLNPTLEQIFDRTDLPVSQEEHADVKDGEVFYVQNEEPELPIFTGRGTLRLTSDVCLFARLTNPFNTARTLTWCSGVYTRGTLGSVRLLTDIALRDENSSYLAHRFTDAKQFAIMVKVPVVSGRALTPDLYNEEARLYEWSDAEPSGEARPDGDAPEASR
ncbi:MAG TPA: helix-turn-helix domain-containing protein [Mycobacteriales bacterium]|jgi:transcriptional regulator with XRE-family HTH domain|nr:helix-turn-helix domain-containing protein [Mycobacteriales bacterium]